MGKSSVMVLQGVVLGRLSTDSSLIKQQNNSTSFVSLIRNLLIYNSSEFRGGEVRPINSIKKRVTPYGVTRFFMLSGYIFFENS